MESNWVELTDKTLPPEFVLVWVQREYGDFTETVLAYHNGTKFSNDKDPSRNCNWYGQSEKDGIGSVPSHKLETKISFSDVTVKRWHPLTKPI